MTFLRPHNSRSRTQARSPTLSRCYRAPNREKTDAVGSAVTMAGLPGATSQPWLSSQDTQEPTHHGRHRAVTASPLSSLRSTPHLKAPVPGPGLRVSKTLLERNRAPGTTAGMAAGQRCPHLHQPLGIIARSVPRVSVSPRTAHGEEF